MNQILTDYKEKYESLRDIDSPIKDVSNMRKLLKSNDQTLNQLQKENLELNNKIKPMESKLIEYEKQILGLNEKLKIILINIQS